MMLKAATFIGHRDLPVFDNSKLKNCIRALIEDYGCERFLCGGMGNFDNICAQAVWELKQIHPHIQNHLVIPYLSFTVQNPFYYDEIIFPAELEGQYFKKCILLRNKYLIDHANAAICYIDHSWGGAYKTYLYAKSNQIRIFDLRL